MMKKMLGGGAKFTYDGESGKFNITGKGSALGGQSNSMLTPSYPNMSSDTNKFWNNK